MKFEKCEIENAKSISIIAFLQKQGFTPVRISNNKYWYKSPLREEKNASFCVNAQKNQWADFSEEKKYTKKGFTHWRDIFDLVSEMFHLNFIQSYEYLTGTDLISEKYIPVHCVSGKGVEIIGEKTITYKILQNYLEERGISLDVANKYCKQIFYKCHGGKNSFAIGFQTDNKEWVLRNPKFKGCSGQDVTTLRFNDKSVYGVFEGFFDFLSFVQLYGTPKINCIILNSVTNISKVYSIFETADKVYLMLDNDTKGKEITQCLQDTFGEKMVDKSYHYAPCKDFNEYLIQKGEML